MTDAFVGGLISDRYRLGDLLGTGGSASVFAAVEVSTGQPVALKILHPHLAGFAETRTAFFAEARAAAGLRHPNLIRVLGQGEHVPVEGSDEPQAWIALALVPGLSLADWIEDRGPLAVSDVLALARGVLRGLAAVHSIGLIHRDVSPANIMVAPNPDGSLFDNAVVLLDFGLADTAGQNTVSAGVLLDVGSNQGSAEATLGALGTVNYVSPEQASGVAVDARGDIYQLGGVLYFGLTAQPPFVRHSVAAVLRAHAQAAPPVPSVVRFDVPRQLDRIVVKALLKDPDSRFQSAIDMLSAIEAVPARVGPLAGASATLGADESASRFAARTRILAPMNSSNGSEPQSTRSPQAGGCKRPVRAGGLIGILVALLFAGGWSLAAQDAADSSESTGTAPPPVTAASPEPSATPLDAAAAVPVLVPELINLNLAAATDALQTTGLVLGTITVVNSSSPGDTVSHILPAAGTRLPAGEAVNLTVTSGSNVIPAVRELTQANAIRILQTAGFASAIALRTSETWPAGTVLDSDPGDGTVHRVTDVVTLLVSTGSAEPTPSRAPTPVSTASATPTPKPTQSVPPTAPPTAPPTDPPTVVPVVPVAPTAITRPSP